MLQNSQTTTTLLSVRFTTDLKTGFNPMPIERTEKSLFRINAVLRKKIYGVCRLQLKMPGKLILQLRTLMVLFADILCVEIIRNIRICYITALFQTLPSVKQTVLVLFWHR